MKLRGMEHIAQGKATHVSAQEFMPLLKNIENDEYVLIDVRNPEEYRNERIEGSLNVPVDALKIGLDEIERETPLLIYCRTGKRCLRAVDQLNDMGFHNIRILDGGIEAWKTHNFKTERN
jgi:rhodanese-related sulfurtransferase